MTARKRFVNKENDQAKQRQAARAMLAALINVMAEADFGEEELAAQCRDAIAAAKAAGIRE
jgi:hypothetical protein